MTNKILFYTVLLGGLVFLVVSCRKEDKPPEPVKDIEGNIYKTVKIGYQVWMAENLKTTKYNDGSDISLVTDTVIWGEMTTSGYCWYNNDESTYKVTYGSLYNGFTVSSGLLCPTGWHVPTDAEWTTLTTFLGGESVAGGKLKEAGTAHWTTPNTGATNEYGFTALPGGTRSMDGTFYYIRESTYWWSSTEFNTNEAWARYNNIDDYVGRYQFNKHYGNSVRCVKD